MVLELDYDCSSLAGSAVQADLCVVIGSRVLDDGKSQPRAAGGLGVALVHPVKPLEDPFLML